MKLTSYLAHTWAKASRALFFSISILIFYQSNGQLHNANWYFGHFAGISFISGQPVELTNSKINSREGVASYSDPTTGNLLFYTNGVKVYDRTSSEMAPSGHNLGGDISSTQSAIVVPNPANPTEEFYIFTTSSCASTSSFQVSEVDLTVGTNGTIMSTTNMNSFITAASATPPSAWSEKVTATLHSNGTDYWIIAHGLGSNNFYVFQVTSTGITYSGTYASGLNYTNCTSATGADDGVGYLKFSSNSSILAAAVFQTGVDIHSFNNTSGAISYQYNLDVTNLSGVVSKLVYGIEFSPNNRYLYVSTQSTTPSSTTTHTGAIQQFDLSSGVYATVLGTQYQVSSGKDYGALQIGPDNKIYCAKEYTYAGGSYTLDIIREPNMANAGCSYLSDGFTFVHTDPTNGNSYTEIGLPNFLSIRQPRDIKDLICISNTSPEYTIWSTQTINAATVMAGKYYIDGIITFDNCLVDITNVDLVFADENSGFKFINGAFLRSNNSVYRPCRAIRKWKGIEFDRLSRAVFNENVVKNAIIAILQPSNSELTITSNEFYNCNTSISIYESANTQCSTSISNNTFKVKDEALAINYTGIALLYSDMYHPISQNDFVYTADFDNSIDRFVGVSLNYSASEIVFNRFTDLLHGITNTNGTGLNTIEDNTLTEPYQLRCM